MLFFIFLVRVSDNASSACTGTDISIGQGLRWMFISIIPSHLYRHILYIAASHNVVICSYPLQNFSLAIIFLSLWFHSIGDGTRKHPYTERIPFLTYDDKLCTNNTKTFNAIVVYAQFIMGFMTIMCQWVNRVHIFCT